MPPPVVRWTFEDSVTGETYVFPTNPRRMTSPFPERAITGETTLAIGGTTLFWEGNTPPHEWSFGGTIFDRLHHDALEYWSLKRVRIFVTDHFGRRYQCIPKSFVTDNEKLNTRRYWYHSYDFTVILAGRPSAATVGEVWQ